MSRRPQQALHVTNDRLKSGSRLSTVLATGANHRNAIITTKQLDFDMNRLALVHPTGADQPSEQHSTPMKRNTLEKSRGRKLQLDLNVGYAHEMVNYGKKRDRLKTLNIGGPSDPSNRLLEKAVKDAELAPELFHTWLRYLGEKHDGKSVQEFVLDALVAMEDNVDVFFDEERLNSIRKLKITLPGYNPTFHEAYIEAFKEETVERQVLARLKIYIADMRWADALTLLHLLQQRGGIDMQKDLLKMSGTILSFSDILETVEVLVFEDAMHSFNSNRT